MICDSEVLREFLDCNLHRVYPLTDASSGLDKTGTFTIPTSLISDIFLCAPNLPTIDRTAFFIENILIRRQYIDITIGYDNGGTPVSIGVFKNIRTDDPVHTTYDFTPFELQNQGDLTPLFHMTGQIIIGLTDDALRYLGSWSFLVAQATITSTRVSQGLLNVQYVQVNNRLFTGNVRLREGANVQLTTSTEVIGGQTVNIIEIAATLGPSADIQLTSDADVLDQLIRQYGQPVLTINGLYPDVDRNFEFEAEDCTTIEAADNKLTLGNPCARPCCDEDANITTILDSIGNLNLRYAQIKSFFDAQSSAINNLQNKLLVLGAEI
jgi:hypothetical protein